MKVILFNGPPSCGKDTAAKAIYAAMGASFDRFSMPIKRAFAATFGARIDEFGNVEGWEKFKDERSALLGGKSYRQWQIDFSENFMKLLYGGDIFPILLLQRMIRCPPGNYMVVPDTGFQVEVDTLIKMASTLHTHLDFLLVRIERDGCDFTKDSRQYVTPTGNCGFVTIKNNTDRQLFEQRIVELAKDWSWST